MPLPELNEPSKLSIGDELLEEPVEGLAVGSEAVVLLEAADAVPIEGIDSALSFSCRD